MGSILVIKFNDLEFFVLSTFHEKYNIEIMKDIAFRKYVYLSDKICINTGDFSFCKSLKNCVNVFQFIFSSFQQDQISNFRML